MQYTKTTLTKFKIRFPSSGSFMEFKNHLKDKGVKPAIIHGGEHKRTGERTFAASFMDNDAITVNDYAKERGKEVETIEL